MRMRLIRWVILSAGRCFAWDKYKKDEASGKEVIDKATFQSFGCETAIAVASLATEMIQGKSRDEVLALKGEELSKDLGPFHP